MDMTKVFKALTDLTVWVKTGLTKKQNKVLVKTTDPLPSEGVDGDICVVVDG